MKRLNASSCTGANSLTHHSPEGSRENSPPLPSPAKQKKLTTTDPIVKFETANTMITSNSQPALTEATVRSQLGTCDISEAPSFRRNRSAGDVSTPESFLESPKASSTDGKRKKKNKKNEEVLDWRNYNEPSKKKIPTDTVKSQGGLHTSTGEQHSNEKSNVNGSPEVVANVRDPTNQFIPDPPSLLRRPRAKCDGSTSSGENQATNTATSTSQGEIMGRKKEETTCGYGQPHDSPLISNSLTDDAPIFGTKNNPVEGILNDDGVNMTKLGLPKSFASSKGRMGKKRTESRSNSSSSERGVLGLTNTYVPMISSMPLGWANKIMAHSGVDGDSIVVRKENGDDGCCDDGLGDMRNERSGEKEVPEHEEKYIDSHCHLDFIYEKYRFTEMQNLREKFNESFLPTFKGCIANFIRPSNFKYSEWIDKVVKDEQVLGTSWGIHPHHAGQMTEESLKSLKNTVVTRRDTLKIVAIGECGVDLSGRNDVSLEKQLEVFKYQVEIAYELDLPIIIHCREGKGMDKDPEDAVLNVLKERPNHPIHRHCFTRDANVAKKWMQTLHDCSFGFTPLVVHSEWFDQLPGKIIPLDRIHLETDAPYFRPLEYKSFNKLPHNVSLPGAAITVAIRISELTGYSLDEVIRRTRGCTERIYRLQKFL